MSGGDTWFDIHGLVSMRVERGCPTERQLREMFRPFLVAEPTDGRDADLVVGATADDPRGELRDASLGEHAYRFTDDAVEVVKDRVRVRHVDGRFEVRGQGELLTSVLPPIEHVAVRRGAAMVHAATLAVGDAGVCLPAWGGVGKTSTVARLTALPEGRFMGDDWAFVDSEQHLLGYAKPMFLKPHHRELYPHVFSERRKPLAPSGMTDTVARLATAVHPVIIRYPRLADVTRRWSPEHMMVHPGDVFPPEKIATRVPLRLVCFVERFEGSTPELTERSTAWMVRRVVGNFHTELPGTSRDLVVALGACGLVGLEDYFADKARAVKRAIAGIPTYALRVPAAMPAPVASQVIGDQVLELLTRHGERPADAGGSPPAG